MTKTFLVKILAKLVILIINNFDHLIRLFWFPSEIHIYRAPWLWNKALSMCPRICESCTDCTGTWSPCCRTFYCDHRYWNSCSGFHKPTVVLLVSACPFGIYLGCITLPGYGSLFGLGWIIKLCLFYFCLFSHRSKFYVTSYWSRCVTYSG